MRFPRKWAKLRQATILYTPPAAPLPCIISGRKPASVQTNRHNLINGDVAQHILSFLLSPRHSCARRNPVEPASRFLLSQE